MIVRYVANWSVINNRKTSIEKATENYWDICYSASEAYKSSLICLYISLSLSKEWRHDEGGHGGAQEWDVGVYDGAMISVSVSLKEN